MTTTEFCQLPLASRISAEKIDKVTAMLKVIAHPLRLEIVEMLQDGKRLSVSEIQEIIGVEQPVASQHLILMQDKGVLASEKSGRNRYFFLKHPQIIEILRCMENCCEKV